MNIKLLHLTENLHFAIIVDVEAMSLFSSIELKSNYLEQLKTFALF